MRHFTERKEPKKMGTKAMIIRLEYAVTNPCGVAAALPVTFLAVSLTVAVIFANVSFTTVSAILLRLSLMFFCPNGPAIPECTTLLHLLPMKKLHVRNAKELKLAFTFF